MARKKRKRREDPEETRYYYEEEEDEFDSFEDFEEKDRDDDLTRNEMADFVDDDEDGDGGETVISDRKKKKPEILGFIVIKKGLRKNDRFDLTKSDIIIGRSQKCCDLILEDEDISKIHCRIRKDTDSNEFLFFDCGSTNGTLVNGEEVHHKTLKSHDTITLGETVEIVFIQV